MGANCSNVTFPDPNVTLMVWQFLGPRCVENSVAIPTAIVYCLILILGVFGNCCTCIVVAKNKSMQTATNLYIVSLAVSDMIILVLGLPFELRSTVGTLYPYSMPLFICKGRAYITEVTSYASILTITAFSVERWLAICFPLKIKVFSKFSRAFRVVAGIWVAALTSALPVAWFVTINKLMLPALLENGTISSTDFAAMQPFIDEYGHIENTEFCALDYYDFGAQKAVINWSFWAFFCVPLTTICILYIHIGVKLKLTIRQLKRQSETAKMEQRAINSRKTVLRMLVAVVVAFFVCWLPFHAQRLMTIYVELSNISVAAQKVFAFTYYFSGFFYYANSAVNPILYSILSRKFRRAFIQALCPSCIILRLHMVSTSMDKTMRSGMSRLQVRQAAISSPGGSGVFEGAETPYQPLPAKIGLSIFQARSVECLLNGASANYSNLPTSSAKLSVARSLAVKPCSLSSSPSKARSNTQTICKYLDGGSGSKTFLDVPRKRAGYVDVPKIVLENGQNPKSELMFL